MRKNNDILKLLQEKENEALWKGQRALIVQPGAIGDCILTVPLVKFLKEQLGVSGVDILGHTEYIGILPGRTSVDSIRSMEAIELYRLFAETKTFYLPDRDPLINFFAEYSWLVTFLGEAGSNFEKNLIFTVNCSHSAEVITLSLKPPEDFGGHLTEFYIEEFIKQSGMALEPPKSAVNECLLKATKADVNKGRELLKESGADFSKKTVLIQPGSGGKNKCWHPDNFLEVAKELIRRNIEVIFLLGPTELERFDEATMQKINNIVKCLTNLSLPDVVGLLSCADFFVGNDSGITHLAAGLGAATVAIFGPTNPNIYRPIGPKVTILTGEAKKFATEPSEDPQHQLLKILTSISGENLDC